MLLSGYDMTAQYKRRKIKTPSLNKRFKHKKKKPSYAKNRSKASKKGRKGINKFGGGGHVHYKTLGFTMGALNYKGEFDQSSSLASVNLKGTRPSLGITFAEKLGPHYHIRAGFMYGRIKGHDSDIGDPKDQNEAFRRLRNLGFTNDIYEAKLDVQYDFINAISPNFMKRVFFTPYVFGGVALFTNNPKNNGKNLRKIGTTGQFLDDSDKELLENYYEDISSEYGFTPKIRDKQYSQFQVAIPFGIGVRQRINSNLDLSFELGIRFTFTDNIDDVEDQQVYVGLNDDYLPFTFTDGINDLIAEGVNGGINDAETQAIADEFGISNVSYNTGQFRGSPKSNFITRRDFYVFTGFNLTYVLKKGFFSTKF